MSDDYFTKAAKRTQPVRDAFAPKNAPAAPKAPMPAKAAAAPTAHKPIGQLQGESLEDFTYMHEAQEKINRKLRPKSVMGKSSPKR